MAALTHELEIGAAKSGIGGLGVLSGMRSASPRDRRVRPLAAALAAMVLGGC